MGALEHVLAAVLPADMLARTRVLAFETDPIARAVLAASKAGLEVEVSAHNDSAGALGSAFYLVEGSPPPVHGLLEPTPQAVLVAGGSPCVGFSRANPSGRGIEDTESSKLWVLPVLISMIRSSLPDSVPVLFVVENVEMADSERDRVSATLGVTPTLLDAGLQAAADRPRLVWTNVPASPVHPKELAAGDVLEPGWRPAWAVPPGPPRVKERFRTFTRPFPPGRPREFPLECMHFSAAQYDERGLAVRADLPPAQQERLLALLTRTRSGVKHSLEARRELAEWIHLHHGDELVRPLTARERERALGMPLDASCSSASQCEWARAALLGNTWSVPVFAAHLALLPQALDGTIAPRPGLPTVATQQEALSSLTPPPGGGARRAEPSRAAGHCSRRA